MPWVGISGGQIRGFGEKAGKGFFDSIEEFDTWELAEQCHEGLYELRNTSELSVELAKVDAYQNIESAHAIKAFEAFSYKFMKAPAEACVHCNDYAQSEGISLEDAVERVWQKNIESSASENARTCKKSALRKSYSSKGS